MKKYRLEMLQELIKELWNDEKTTSDELVAITKTANIIETKINEENERMG